MNGIVYAGAVTGVDIVAVYLLWKITTASLHFCVRVVRLHTRSQVAGER